MSPRTRRIAVGAVAALLLLSTPALGAAAEENIPGQQIDADQAQGTGRVILDRGHVDIGPTLGTGEWRTQIHDETATPSFWRMPGDVVLRVSDAARMTVPDDEAYAFLGVEPGSDVWVVPQTENRDVVWIGWNTQEPGVLDALDGGATLSMVDFEGPGELDVYLQAGNFGEPESLWDTTLAFPQDAFIEINTHTHANWVFSEPGVYLIEMQWSARLTDGSEVAQSDVLRVAVGDSTDPEAAFEATLAADAPASEPEPEPELEATATAAELGDDMTGTVLAIVGGVVALAVIAAVVVVVVATRRSRARVQAEIYGSEGRR